MSTPLRIGETRSLDVFTGIILTVDQVPEHNSEDLVKDFTEVGKEYEKRAFNVDSHNITAVMIPCKLIFNYYGPVMLVPPSGRAWLAEQDFSRISDYKALAEIFTRRGWYEFISQTIGLKEAFGSMDNIHKLQNRTLWSADMVVEIFKGGKFQRIYITIQNPMSRKALKNQKEFDATMTSSAEVDSESEEGDESTSKLPSQRKYKSFREFLDWIDETKKGQIFDTKGFYGEVDLDWVGRILSRDGSYLRNFEDLKETYNKLIQEHKGDYDKVLSIMGNDLVDAAYET